MPSIIPSYVYTLFASLIVGAIIVGGCTMETENVRNEAVTQQLSNIEEYVAAQSLAVITHVMEDSQNITQCLNVPAEVANQVYWVSLSNGSFGAQVKSGLGSVIVINDQPGAVIPAQVAVSGVYCSGSGRAFLQCYVENQTVVLTLTSVT